MDEKTNSYLWSMTFPSYVENLKKEQRELSYSFRGLQYPSDLHADYDERILLVEQLQAMDFYHQEPNTVLDFLKNKKGTLLQSDYVAPSDKLTTEANASTMLDYLIKVYETKAKEEIEPDTFSSDIPHLRTEAFIESVKKGEAPTAEQLGTGLLDQDEIGPAEHTLNIEDEDTSHIMTEPVIKNAASSSAEHSQKTDMDTACMSDNAGIPWDTPPTGTAVDYFQDADSLPDHKSQRKFENPHSAEPPQGYMQTNLLGQFISGCCNVLRSIFSKPKAEVSNDDYPRPLTREAFDEKVNGLLKTWKFRRDHFDRHWLNMMRDEGTVEDLVERIRLNPIMSRAMEDYNNADTENERLQVSKHLTEAMADPHSKFAPELKRDVSALNLGLNKLRQSSRACVEASLKEPLNRFGCDQAVEKNLSEFFETVLDKPELKLLESEKGENLYEKASRFAHETLEFLKHIKEKLAELVLDSSARQRASLSPGA